MINSKLIGIGLGVCIALPGQVYAGKSNINMDDLIVVASNTAAGTSAQADVPMGQSGNDVSLLPEESGAESARAIFGTEGGYVHPYISVEGGYTDNVFNVNTDETSSAVYTISPGVWVSVPRKKIIPVSINPNNSSAGGLQLEIEDYKGTDPYQVYALAGMDINMYAEDSDLNSEDYYFEGLARYNMASGLSLQLVDRFTIGHDEFSAGNATAENLREFDTNLFMATADWDLTEKFRFRVDFSNFMLGYDEDINAFLERRDNVIDLYAYYKYSVKTSVFLQYRYTDVEYDSAGERDNTQDYVYGGIRWSTTDKLSFQLKGGMQDKQYDVTGNGYEDSDEFVVDLQTIYRFSEKTEFSLDLYRNNEESDSELASEKVVLGTRFGYTQKLTEKIVATLDLAYENAEYAQLAGTDRDEDRYFLRPGVQYTIKDWLMAELAYSFDKRDSTDDTFDYDTNTFLLNLNFAL